MAKHNDLEELRPIKEFTIAEAMPFGIRKHTTATCPIACSLSIAHYPRITIRIRQISHSHPISTSSFPDAPSHVGQRWGYMKLAKEVFIADAVDI